MSLKYAYLDKDGYVQQWAAGDCLSAVEGLTLHQLLPGELVCPRLRMIDGALVPYLPDVLLAEVQAGAIADANADRDRRLAAFDRFTYEGVLYDGDARAEAAITLAARSAALDLEQSSITWRAFDNADVLLTPTQLLALEVAMIEAKARYAAQHHARCRELKAAIAAAESRADVRLVVEADAQSAVFTEDAA